MTAYIIDIECNNLLRPALDYSSLPYKLQEWFKLWCVVIRKVGSPEAEPLSLVLGECTKANIQAALEGCTELIGHNHIGYDLPVLQLLGLFDYTVGYPNQSSTLFGEPVLLTDTLVWSRLLNPDRYGGHGLGPWGQRLGFPKGDFHDFHEYSEEMLTYCIQDTLVTEKVHYALLKEKKGFKTDWSRAYAMESKIIDLTLKQEVFGFDFNIDLAHKNLEELDGLLKERCDRVSPILPPRRLNKGEQKYYTPPIKQFLKNGKPTAFIDKFVAKVGAEVKEIDEEYYISFEGKLFQLPYTDPIKTSLEADISDLNNLKGYVLSLGWVPHEWNERDLGLDSKKRKRETEDVVKAVQKYVEDTRESEFRRYRCSLLNCTFDRLEPFLMGMLSKGRQLKVPTTPLFRVGVAKDICPNLERLGEKAEFVKDVVEYFTYKHRRTSIAGGRVDDFDEPLSGFISNTREDGRIPTPAITLGANTGRYRHSIVCNIPRITSLYGGPMRSLFGAGKGFYQLGFDFASLEARIQGHYVLKYEGGHELAEALVAEKPNDIHCYSEDTQLLTLGGWKLFTELTPKDKVAQYDNGKVNFVTPSEIIISDYEGIMYEDTKSGYKVTPNHRVIYTRYSEGKGRVRVSLAEDLVPSSDKRYLLGGVTTKPDINIKDEFLQLCIATQADGHLNFDSSAISYSFVKQGKADRLLDLLTKLKAKTSEHKYFRKGRYETVVRLCASPLAEEVRAFLGGKKQLQENLLSLSSRQIEVVLKEVKFWDGSAKSNGDVVLDTTCKATVNILQTLCSLVGRKCKVSDYLKETSFGSCQIHRAYMSYNSSCVMTANKALVKSQYKGKIGCVTVPSGAVLVKRNNVIIVSGNSVNAQKLSISRDDAKAFGYAIMFGAQAKKLAKMIGITEAEAMRLFIAYWEAVPALGELKHNLEEYWKANGSKFILGLDGRFMMTRSKHSLTNVLFQGGGAVMCKWSIVRIAQQLEERGLLGNPFVHAKDDPKVWQMCVMHDEAQYAVHPSLMDVRQYSSQAAVELAEEPLCSAIGHGSKGLYRAFRTAPVDCINEGIEIAVKELKLKVELGFEWSAGANWAQCH